MHRRGSAIAGVIAAGLSAALVAVPAGSPVHSIDEPPPSAVEPRSDGDHIVTFVGDHAAEVLAEYTATDIHVEAVHEVAIDTDVVAGVASTSWAIVDGDRMMLDRLRADPRVLAVEPDGLITIDRAGAVPGPAVLRSGVPYGLDRSDQRTRPVDGSFTPSATGAGVIAYVLDDGLYTPHPDFAGRVPRAYVDRRFVAPNDQVFDPACEAPHGTHVAGTIGGSLAGMAPSVTIVPVRVFACDGTAPISAVIEALDAIVAHHPSGQPGVVNMSNGGVGHEGVDEATRRVIASGLTVVAAAGNQAADACTRSPARVSEVITVGATTEDDRLASFSNAGRCVDIHALGDPVMSAGTPFRLGAAWPDTRYVSDKGTSFASPHVAGFVAQILQRDPALTPAQVKARVVGSATTCIISMPSGVPADTPNRLLYVGDPSVPDPGDAGAVCGQEELGDAAATFVAMMPARFVDTRATRPMPAGSVVEVPMAGRAGVPDGVEAVVLNVTVVEPSAAGYVTVFPCGGGVPEASNVNFVAGQTVANAVVSKVGASGSVCVFSSVVTELLVDVNGALLSGYTGVVPERVVDTRATRTVPAGSVVEVPVVGRAGIPGGVEAVVLNVTVVEPSAAGYVTVFPCGGGVPEASNVNFVAGQTVANAVVSKVGASGSVCVFSSVVTELLVDVNGAVERGFAGLTPVRLVDTRSVAPLVAESVTRVRVAGVVSVPGGAEAVVLNVTVVEPSAAGYVTVFPCGGGVPEASNVNFVAGQTVANAVVSQVGALDAVCVFSSVATDLLVDVNGAFG